MRKIAVVTGTRAEYGLLYWLIKALDEAPDVDLQLIVTGAHLCERFGATWRQIAGDGFEIAAKVEMVDEDDSPAATARALGRGVIGLSGAFERLDPDIVVLLGDRYEIFAAAAAAMMHRIPIAHIHGGETTRGAIDDAIRHAVSKMAHLHFVAAPAFQQKLLDMGETDGRIHVVGAAGLDNIARLELLDREALEKDLGMALHTPLFLVTYHPETLSADPVSGVDGLLDALDLFEDATILITGTNADAFGRRIAERLEGFAAEHSERVRNIVSLGQQRYLSALKLADICVGNSSSGLLEAPALGTATVNIGMRQAGRLRAPSVIDCEDDAASVETAVKRALTPEFQELAARRETPYGMAGASDRIAEVLRTVDLDRILIKDDVDASSAQTGNGGNG